MAGEQLATVKQGLKDYIAGLRGDGQSLSQTWISVITFGSTAQVSSRLAPLSDFTLPELHAAGGTALGAALKLAAQCVEDDKARLTANGIPFKRPIAKIITDGMPTDNFRSGAKAFNQCGFSKVEVIALRPEVDEKIFKGIDASVTFMPAFAKENIGNCLNSSPRPTIVSPDSTIANLLKALGVSISEAEIDDFERWLIKKAWKEYNEEKQESANEAARRVRQAYVPLPPAVVGKPYSTPKFELPDEAYAYGYEFVGLNEIGLTIAKDDLGFYTFEGTPTKAGLFDIAITFKFPGWLPCNKLLKRVLTITVNP